MADPQTDVVDDDLRTDGADVEDEPANTDEIEDTPKTRAEKTAAKKGISVEELKETKSGKKVSDRLGRIESALEPFIAQAETKKAKAEFESLELEGVTFDDFQSEYDELISIGADPEKAKAKVLANLETRKEGLKKEARSSGKAKASLPPRGDYVGQPPKYQILSKEKFSKLRNEKGIEYYQKYCKYCDDANGGKYWTE